MAEKKKTSDRPTLKTLAPKGLKKKITALGPPSIQGTLFHVEKQVEHDGIEMGVLDNGIPYLTESGLARMCGVDRKPINRLAVNWAQERSKPRGQKIQSLLTEAGYTENTLYLKSEYNGVEINAYTEPVCIALLEYYAFLSIPPRENAINAFRILAKRSFRELIYVATGYKPNNNALESWKHFHDRLDMIFDNVPNGYFCVFKEIASMIVPMIRAGVVINDKVIPDISVGLAWSKFWKANNFEDDCGPRIKYDHEYPDYYPQAKKNPQPAHAYPDEALGVFRQWLKENYIINKLPKYLLSKAKKGAITNDSASLVIESLSQKQLEKRSKKRLN